MQTKISVLAALLLLAATLPAQVEPYAGTWKTWFISSGKDYRLPAPAPWKPQVARVLEQQQNLDSAGRQQIVYWNAGAPGYRWQEMISKLWMYDTSYQGPLAYLLLGVATYDATIAAWDTKYAWKRPRPFAADGRVTALVPKPESPSYPCEHSVAAGVGATVIGHFYPALADSMQRQARRVMASRVAAGMAFPDDTEAGFALGKKIAEQAIARTKGYTVQTAWDGKIPQGPGYWNGKNPMFPLAGRNKTIVLDSSSQFRPGPPPDFAKDMAELKNYKQGFRSMANAFLYASQSPSDDLMHKKIFEYNLHLNPPRAARLYALAAIGTYDGFAACWDAKYTYWGIRPDQYDTTYHPAILITPPFPGYPSGHAVVSGVINELLSYYFPAEKALFQKRAKEGAESRFQAGIHFRTDNEVGLDMGRKIGALIVQKARADGADGAPPAGQVNKSTGRAGADKD